MAILPKVNEHFIYKSKSGCTYLARRISGGENGIRNIVFTELALLPIGTSTLDKAPLKNGKLWTRGGWSTGDRLIGVVPEKTLEEYIYNNPEYFI